MEQKKAGGLKAELLISYYVTECHQGGSELVQNVTICLKENDDGHFMDAVRDDATAAGVPPAR